LLPLKSAVYLSLPLRPDAEIFDFGLHPEKTVVLRVVFSWPSRLQFSGFNLQSNTLSRNT
jgi:hypothetical protein